MVRQQRHSRVGGRDSQRVSGEDRNMFEPWQALDDVYKEDRVAHERSPGVCDVEIVGK